MAAVPRLDDANTAGRKALWVDTTTRVPLAGVPTRYDSRRLKGAEDMNDGNIADAAIQENSGLNIKALWAAAQTKGYERGEWATYAQWQERGRSARAKESLRWRSAIGARVAHQGNRTFDSLSDDSITLPPFAAFHTRVLPWSRTP